MSLLYCWNDLEKDWLQHSFISAFAELKINTFRKTATHQFICVFAELKWPWKRLIATCPFIIVFAELKIPSERQQHINLSVSVLNWNYLDKDWLQHIHLSVPLLNWKYLQKDCNTSIYQCLCWTEITLTKTDCSTSIYKCLCWTENTFRKIVTHQFISVFAELKWPRERLPATHPFIVSLLNWSNLQKHWLQHLHLSPPKLLHWRGSLQKDQLGHIHLSVFAELKYDPLQKDWLGHWDSVSLSVVNSVCLSVANILRDLQLWPDTTCTTHCLSTPGYHTESNYSRGKPLESPLYSAVLLWLVIVWTDTVSTTKAVKTHTALEHWWVGSPLANCNQHTAIKHWHVRSPRTNCNKHTVLEYWNLHLH